MRLARPAGALASLLVLTLLTGCGGDGGSPASTTSAVTAPSTASAAPSTGTPDTTASATAASEYVACPGDGDQPFTLTLGGREFRGLVRGTGTDTVVLSHQSNGDECDLAVLGAALVKAGHRVVSWTTPQSLPTPRDLELLVAHERDQGARTVALVGASWGGALSIVAAAHVQPAPRAVVALSAAGDADKPGDVVAAAHAYRGPLMAVAGEADTGFAGLVPLLAAAHSGRESTTVVPGTSMHGHDFVFRTSDPWVARVVAFLRT